MELSNKKMYNLVKELENRLIEIEKLELEYNIKSLMDKIRYIEEYLNRRSRGFYKKDKGNW